MEWQKHYIISSLFLVKELVSLIYTHLRTVAYIDGNIFYTYIISFVSRGHTYLHQKLRTSPFHHPISSLTATTVAAATYIENLFCNRYNIKHQFVVQTNFWFSNKNDTYTKRLWYKPYKFICTTILSFIQ